MRRNLHQYPLGPLERKEADPEDKTKKEQKQAPDTSEIKKAVDNFMATFKTFQDKVDEELKQLKTKGNPDAVTKDEIKKLNDALDEQKKLVDDLRLKERRPMVELADGTKQELTEDQIAHKKAFADYFRKGNEGNLRELEAKTLSVGSDPDGGYLVPVEMETAIDRILTEISPIRSIASVRQIGRSSYKKPVNLAGTGSGWVGEQGARPQTQTPNLAELEFPAMELYAMPAATQSLLDDAVVNIDQWLASEVDIEFAQQEGRAFVLGNGASMPRGFLAAPTVDDDNWEWGKVGYVPTGAAGDFNTANPGDEHDNLVDLVYSLKSGYRANARFVMNRKTQARIRKIKDADGYPLWQPGLANGQPATLLGFPITEAEDMPDIAANSLSIAFGDFRRGYLIVDRMGVRVLRDPYSSKPYVLFYTTKRVGGGIQNYEAFKLMKFAAS